MSHQKKSIIGKVIVSSIIAVFMMTLVLVSQKKSFVKGEEVTLSQEIVSSSSDAETSSLSETEETMVSEINESQDETEDSSITQVNELQRNIRTQRKAITYEMNRQANYYYLSDIQVSPDFGVISSLTISMPEGVTFNTYGGVPIGWETSNQPTDKTINYLLKNNHHPQNVQQFLATIRFMISDDEADGVIGNIKVSLSSRLISARTDASGVTHYYERIPERITWFEAYNAARSKVYRGLRGYLATITSEEEHDYIYNSVATNAGWLGGTRLTLGSFKINDQTTIPTAESNYVRNRSEWYWASGPEAQNVFYIGQRYQNGQVPPGAYAAWSRLEPNNSGGNETVLQFAFSNSKYWNDLPATWVGTNGTNEGYYVEYSAYGSQVEISENDHEAALPQKVIARYIDDETNEEISSSVAVGSTFKIGTSYSTIPYRKVIARYDLMAINGSESGRHTSEIQEVTYVYQRKPVITELNIQQVILNARSDLVVPSIGLAELVNEESAQTANFVAENKILRTTFPSANQNNFTEYAKSYVETKRPNWFYHIRPVVPQYYKYEGYLLTTTQVVRNPANRHQGSITIDGRASSSQWLTIYLSPRLNVPAELQLYSWDYGNNNDYAANYN